MSKKLIVLLVLGMFLATAAPAALFVVADNGPLVHLVDNDRENDMTDGKPTKPAPTQPAEVLPWGVDKIDAELAQSYWTGEGVKVAILDTGIDTDHLDLKANLAGGVNFVVIKGRVNSAKYEDDNGHGTHVAGTIAAEDNTIGVIGVAPAASIYAVKVLDRNGNGYLTDVIKGIEWAITNNMDIISMSLSTSYDYPDLKAACKKAFEAGIVIVAAAGNSGSSVEYPAAYDDYVIAVSATDSSDLIASWSNRGSQIDLAAPGVGIYSTYNNGLYTYMSGTSMACPHVSGSAALVIASYGTTSWTPSDIQNKLTSKAKDLGAAGFDNLYGNGLVNVNDALL